MPNTTETTDLKWLVSPSTSCLHAVDAMRRGMPFADASLAATISDAATGLHEEIKAQQLPATRFWQHLLGLAVGIDSNRELVDVALTKTIGRDRVSSTAVENIAGWISRLETDVQRDLPNMVDELGLRAGPLRQHWEACGPGLMRQIAQWTDARVLVPRADVVLVQPALGGGGASHLAYNSVRIEAVLVNPHSSLPEVLRLAWMLAQLNMDLPIFADAIHGDRLSFASQLSMLPVALTAAEQLDLVQCDQATIEMALNAWHVLSPLDVAASEVVHNWWQTYLDTRPAWHVALAALDRMLA